MIHRPKRFHGICFEKKILFKQFNRFAHAQCNGKIWEHHVITDHFRIKELSH